MMAVLLRSVGAVAAGSAVTIVLVMAVELLSAVVHPFPGDFKGTTEELCRHVQNYPPWILAVAVFAWGVTGFAGTWTAGRLGNRIGALVLGLLILTALIFNLSSLPYPVWFK